MPAEGPSRSRPRVAWNLPSPWTHLGCLESDPNRARLKRVMSFVMLYYGLWAGSDALILWGGLDAGWLLRVVPNQLYYVVWIPFVYATFFSERAGRISSL